MEIEEWIYPGPLIISEGWSSCLGIPKMSDGIYTHAVVNHTSFLADPDYAENIYIFFHLI